jgi:antitoxin component of RelBE/YafQ-DinJ toxin-antitoxin module
MKIKKKTSGGSVKIDPKVLEEARKVCKAKGLLISYYVSEAVKTQNIHEKA